jgi:hypothetical protein
MQGSIELLGALAYTGFVGANPASRSRQRSMSRSLICWHDDEAIRTALKEMRRSGVDIDRAPKEALDLVIAANVPVEDHPALRERGRSR